MRLARALSEVPMEEFLSINILLNTAIIHHRLISPISPFNMLRIWFQDVSICAINSDLIESLACLLKKMRLLFLLLVALENVAHCGDSDCYPRTGSVGAAEQCRVTEFRNALKGKRRIGSGL